MRGLKNFSLFLLAMFSGISQPLSAKNNIPLTLETAVTMAMGNSYRIKQLEMGIERSRYWLTERQASLKSSVSMNLKAPEFNAVSDYKWDSELKKDEMVRQNTRLWQMEGVDLG